MKLDTATRRAYSAGSHRGRAARSPWRGPLSRLAERLRLTPNRLWVLIFATWLLFLSGGLTGLTGSPGMAQLLRLSGFLGQKRGELARAEDSLHSLQIEAEGLENSSAVQERAIRDVLGFVGADETVFEFPATEP
ncbi:MAG: hypothetical protein IT285_11670 [Bdellovibrionales bacterium]|nr:hypothetical protein [Bdellovibrionales bacterium]